MINNNKIKLKYEKDELVNNIFMGLIISKKQIQKKEKIKNNIL